MRQGPVDGFILAATSGEGMSLRADELERLVTVTRSELAGSGRRLPILLGLSGASTARLLEALDETATWPIDGYLIASPYYLRPSQRGLLQHFTALADHAAWPIVLYNIPYRTGVSLTNETLLQLALHPNIVGMKDCGTDRAQSIDFLSRRPPGFRVLTGEDALYHEAIADGADGAILLSAHLHTEAFAAVQTLMKQGDRPGALACWKEISSLTRLLFAEPSPAPGEVLAGARRTDRQRASAAADGGGERGAGRLAGRGNRAAQSIVVAAGLAVGGSLSPRWREGEPDQLISRR